MATNLLILQGDAELNDPLLPGPIETSPPYPTTEDGEEETTE
ncbi:hypothetical protein [Gymnodinialimonas ulvae]